MFWDNPYNQTLVDIHCQTNWGVSPHRKWISAEYGGRALLQGHSNIVFSSGSFDGWSSAGIATHVAESSITSILIDGGAHHLDLMFSHEDDPESVKLARQLELDKIRQWIAEYPHVPKARSWGDDL